MAYIINEITIDNDILNANVTITLPDKSELVCNVPVKFPKTKEEVIAAIEARVKAEDSKNLAAPTLTVIKAAIDAQYTGKSVIPAAEKVA